MHKTNQSGGETLERERERLFAIAYGMLGVTAGAEDVVFFRFFVRRLGTQPVTVRIDLDPPRAVSAGGDLAVRYQARMNAFSGFSATTLRSSGSRPRVIK